MKKTNLIVIGGFLGAGKTTSILAMAKHMLDKGHKIGIVTNDQGSQLVDTAFLADNGLPVLEVDGGCFCCNFDEFTNKVNQLTEELKPDIILAEPVGSCTDLVATIFKPMQQQSTDKFALRPLSIVVDPKRLRRLMMQTDTVFPNEINYLFEKQLEEADIIILNKIDALNENEIKIMKGFLEARFPGVEVLAVSAREALNIDKWADLLCGTLAENQKTLDIDYKTYGDAESYLGWLNCRISIKSNKKEDWNAFLLGYLDSTKQRLMTLNAEIAHLKAYSIGSGDWAKISLTSIYETSEFSRCMQAPVKEIQLIINARVNLKPDVLKEVILKTLDHHTVEKGLIASGISIECFSPARPNPKYRIAG